jgi:DNA polymerase III subunit gamma/tau
VVALELGDVEGEPTPGTPPPESASSPAASRAEVLDNDHWPSFVRWLGGPHPRLAAKLSQSRLAGVSETEVRLEVMEIFAERFQDPRVLGKLEDAAASYFGRNVQWKIGVLPPSRGETASPAKAGPSKHNSRRIVMENTVVQQALEILGGELLDIKKLKKGQKESP